MGKERHYASDEEKKRRGEEGGKGEGKEDELCTKHA